MATRKMVTTKNVLSTVASVAATAMLIRTIANDFLPTELRNYIFSGIQTIFHNYSSEFTIVIEEFRGLSLNQVFEAADTYLGTKSIESIQRIILGKAENEKNLAITIDRNQDIVDVYEGVAVKWKLICKKAESGRLGGEYMRDMNATLRSEIRSYELSFHKEHKKKVLSSYLPYILEKSKAIKEESKAIKLHTVTNHRWASNAINLDHPMTFKTLAMDSELKDTILEDLDNFIKGKEFYRRIGKAWKRGYLLYGPPGTGKSSLIAAMANYLNFDIYDLDLTAVKSNSQLRKMLLSMPSRSILVIEDIDCTVNLQNRASEDKKPRDDDENKVTLSGLLNFIDGLWSCCGNERIIIFTTNHKDSLDPALLRPGRMDLHIHMSYCTISAFKQLAFNYLRISHHQLFDQIEEILTKAEVTPAEVAGELMKNCDEQVSLQALLQLLYNKIAVKNEEKTKADMESIK